MSRKEATVKLSKQDIPKEWLYEIAGECRPVVFRLGVKYAEEQAEKDQPKCACDSGIPCCPDPPKPPPEVYENLHEHHRDIINGWFVDIGIAKCRINEIARDIGLQSVCAEMALNVIAGDIDEIRDRITYFLRELEQTEGEDNDNS